MAGVRGGVRFEYLDITAGEDVAFAFGLLRCGTAAEFERDPNQRLRLTIGFARRRAGGP